MPKGDGQTHMPRMYQTIRWQAATFGPHQERAPCSVDHLIPDHTCPNCEKIFYDVGKVVHFTACKVQYFQKHKLSKHIENGPCAPKTYPCHICGKRYTLKKRLLEHMRKEHPEQFPAKKSHRLSDIQGKRKKSKLY